MRAQLILVGGRPMPNMLTILHEKPDIIVAITSKDRKEEIPYLESSVRELLKDTKPKCILDTSSLVDAFNLSEIKAACESALSRYQGATWLFNITGATTIMSIGAYEVAQAHPEAVQWWYLDTAHTSIVTLLGSKPYEELFKIMVKNYLTASYCTLEDGDLEDYRTIHETQWLPFAQLLGRNPRLASFLKDLVKAILDINRAENRRITQSTPQSYELKDLPSEILSMLEEAARVGIVNNWNRDASTCRFLLSEPQYKFLDGTWLEVYTWKEAKQIDGFYNDEWGKKIRDRHGRGNQLDLALTYKAQLLIIECKTGNDAFQARTFQTIESVANALGRTFVTKILVTSLPVTEDEVRIRAKSSDIAIISRDELPDVGTKLVEIAKKHTGI